MNENELKEILKLHNQWLKTNGSEGQKADLSYADLWGADLSDANLRNADLDFSCWPLWCGSIGVKVDEKIARQLMYHTLIVMLDSGIEIPETKEKLIKFANDSHVVTRYNCKKLGD